jgi:hypothetical protein
MWRNETLFLIPVSRIPNSFCIFLYSLYVGAMMTFMVTELSVFQIISAITTMVVVIPRYVAIKHVK